MPMPDYSDMVDELGPDSLAACSGSTSVLLAGVGGSAALQAASSATSKQQDGAAVPLDPRTALRDRARREGVSAASGGGGGGIYGKQHHSRRKSAASAATKAHSRAQRRLKWNSGCSSTGWIVAPRPKPRLQPAAAATSGINDTGKGLPDVSDATLTQDAPSDAYPTSECVAATLGQTGPGVVPVTGSISDSAKCWHNIKSTCDARAREVCHQAQADTEHRRRNDALLQRSGRWQQAWFRGLVHRTALQAQVAALQTTAVVESEKQQWAADQYGDPTAAAPGTPIQVVQRNSAEDSEQRDPQGVDVDTEDSTSSRVMKQQQAAEKRVVATRAGQYDVTQDEELASQRDWVRIEDAGVRKTHECDESVRAREIQVHTEEARQSGQAEMAKETPTNDLPVVETPMHDLPVVETPMHDLSLVEIPTQGLPIVETPMQHMCTTAQETAPQSTARQTVWRNTAQNSEEAQQIGQADMANTQELQVSTGNLGTPNGSNAGKPDSTKDAVTNAELASATPLGVVTVNSSAVVLATKVVAVNTAQTAPTARNNIAVGISKTQAKKQARAQRHAMELRAYTDMLQRVQTRPVTYTPDPPARKPPQTDTRSIEELLAFIGEDSGAGAKKGKRKKR